MNNWVSFVRKMLAIRLPASGRSWRSSCKLEKVLFACFTRYSISSSNHANFTLIAFRIWFIIVFAKLTELTRFTISGFVWILGLFEVWVCSYFLDLVCYYCGASKASGAYSVTFGFCSNWGSEKQNRPSARKRVQELSKRWRHTSNFKVGKLKNKNRTR